MSYITIVDNGNQHIVVKGYAITKMLRHEICPTPSCWSYKTANIKVAVERSPTLAAMLADLECEKGTIFNNQCDINFY